MTFPIYRANLQQGQWWFLKRQTAKDQYRKFKIKSPAEPNDILMLKEVLQRRFSGQGWKYPKAILIDGGKGQLNAAIEVVPPQIKVMSIAKGRQELFVAGQKFPTPLKNLPQKIYNLIKSLDEEAHRFAVTYHRKLREKALLD
jgi:excinuclease ABC subunit C